MATKNHKSVGGDVPATNKATASQSKGKASPKSGNVSKVKQKTASGKINKASVLRVELFNKFATTAKELYSSKERPTIKSIMDELKKRGCEKPDLVRYFLIGSGASRKNAEGKVVKFAMFQGVPEYKFLAVDIKRLQTEGKEIPFIKSFASKNVSRFEKAKDDKK